MRKHRTPLRRHHNHIPKLPSIKHTTQVSLIKYSIVQCVGDEEWLFEVGLNVLDERLFGGTAAFGLVDIVDEVVVDEVDGAGWGRGEVGVEG